MFKNVERKQLYMEVRVVNMKIMKTCLEGFKRTGDEDYWKYAEIFGGWSKKNKQWIDELSTG